jgi:hypothetical protein
MRHTARTESPSPTSPRLQSGISIALATTLPTPENFFARTSSGYGSHIVSLATSDFARMDSALANFRRGAARGRRESRAHWVKPYVLQPEMSKRIRVDQKVLLWCFTLLSFQRFKLLLSPGCDSAGTSDYFIIVVGRKSDNKTIIEKDFPIPHKHAGCNRTAGFLPDRLHIGFRFVFTFIERF